MGGATVMLWIAATAALAADPDCRVSTEDYAELKAELRDLRRRGGRPLHVAGDAPECENALEALEANDPFLGIELVESPPGSARANIEHSMQRDRQQCGAVLEPGPEGWWLREIGDCGPLEPLDHHLFTVGTWMLSGASVRYNRELTPGFSALIDLGVEVFDPRETRDATDAPLSWGLMGGVDANRSSLKGGYLGMRGGFERIGVAADEVDASTVAQGIVGYRFVAKGAALQVGAGAMMRVPTGDYVNGREMAMGPMLEARLGLAR